MTCCFSLARTLTRWSIDPQRSLAEVNRDYSAMTNLAEYLVQAAGVPFREAHEFASRLTDYGRQNGLRPPQIAYAAAARIYQEYAAARSRYPKRSLRERSIRATLSRRAGAAADRSGRKSSGC